MGGAEKNKKRKEARVGLVCNWVWAGLTHELRVGSNLGRFKKNRTGLGEGINRL